MLRIPAKLHRENKVYLQADYAQNGSGKAGAGSASLKAPPPLSSEWQLGRKPAREVPNRPEAYGKRLRYGGQEK